MEQRTPSDLHEIQNYDVMYGLHRIDWIRRNAPEGKRIVDIGGNTGHTFNGYNRDNVYTVDLDVYDIKNFVRANAEELPFKDNEFDVAVLAEILEHVENPEKAIKEALRVAKKLIITVPYEHYWSKESRPFHLFDTIVKDNDGNLLNEAIKGNPTCVDFYTEDNHKHLFHHRFFTPETIEQTVSSVTDKCFYTIILENNNMPCIGMIIE